MKKKILITGGNGHLGTEIFNFLNKKFICKKIDRSFLEKKNKIKLNKYIKNFSPNIIINSAGIVGIKLAEINKKMTKEINTELPKNLAIISNKLKIHLIQISTHSIFDGYRSKIGFYENIKPKPISYYANTKYNAEKVIVSKCNAYTILRLPYLFSSNLKFKTNVLKKIIHDIENGYVEINKKETSSLADTNKAAKAIYDIILNKAKGIYHYADQGSFNWHDLTKYIANKLKIKVNIKNKIKISQQSFNSSLLSDYSFYSYSSWQYGIDKVLKKYRANKK